MRRMPTVWDARTMAVVLSLPAVLSTAGLASEKVTIERIPARQASSRTAAVRVANADLVHTTQLLPTDNSATEPAQPSKSVLARLDRLLDEFHSQRGDVVKLNVYVRDAAVRLEFEKQLAAWSGDELPAVAYVATAVPGGKSEVAMDAVFASRRESPVKGVARIRVDALGGRERRAHASVLPKGDVVYVSGQAEPGDLAGATRDTLAALLRTLKHLRLDHRHIVAVKCFLRPMSDVSVVDEEIAKFFGDSTIPPISHVEWISGSRPIEIELIAWAPAEQADDTVTYVTPPWMKSSPVFSRVARIHGDERIYISGLTSKHAGDGAAQVRDVFADLQQILRDARSDLEHLAKATYYVSDDDASSRLNQLRPEFYDRNRPPAASKALVKDVGTEGRSFAMVIIAAPAPKSGLRQGQSVDESVEPSPTEFSCSLEVEFGPDRGQSLGTLFELKNAQGRVVAGAGFQDAYNTRFRTGRHVLQFFVKPKKRADHFTIERLPHPDLDCGVYLFDFDEQLYVWSSVRNNSVRRWDERKRQWTAELPPGVETLRSGDGVMRLGAGRLVFSQNTAWYNDRQILTPPNVGELYNFYYALGRLFFYHRHQAETGAFTKIYACPWTPESDAPVDLSAAVVLTTKYERETPFSWGQFDDQVLTVSNMGGIYVFERGKWNTVLAPDNTVSYQVYSALGWHDRLLLAQYPTGNIFEYRGREPRRLSDWPPVLPGVSRSARECQTLAIYRGDLLAGVWPWAELWRYNGNEPKWRSMGRAFSHPQLTDKQTHPYEAEANRYGLVTNHWGQRITSMIPIGESLFLSTSSKGTSVWENRYDFLFEEQRREYGAVLRLHMLGNLATQIEWQSGPTRIECRLQEGRVSIRQDGKELAAAALPKDFAVDLSELEATWAKGAFGPLSGRLVSRTFDH